MRATVEKDTPAGGLFLLCLAAWAIPGAAHLWLGRRTKGLVFLIVLPLMFAIGVGVAGRLFPFSFADPLVGLEALADVGLGLPYFIASAMGCGVGDMTAVTYEYGNAFINDGRGEARSGAAQVGSASGDLRCRDEQRISGQVSDRCADQRHRAGRRDAGCEGLS